MEFMFLQMTNFDALLYSLSLEIPWKWKIDIDILKQL